VSSSSLELHCSRPVVSSQRNNPDQTRTTHFQSQSQPRQQDPMHWSLNPYQNEDHGRFRRSISLS